MNCTRLYYRISDKSHTTPKLIGTNKEVCLKNFCRAFAEIVFGSGSQPPQEGFVPPVVIICDNCSQATLDMIRETGLPCVETQWGNAGSLIFALELALKQGDDDDVAYFCEDDYLHLASAPDLLREGLSRSDYITLYDHPDKYTKLYDGGEVCKVLRMPISHWRQTISTCMTFGARIKALREDIEIWQKYASSKIPKDHLIFTELRQKGRNLLVPIPGVACHVDLAFSARIGRMSMEPWAIDLMIDRLEREIGGYTVSLGNGSPEQAAFIDKMEQIMGDKTGAERLLALDALRSSYRLPFHKI